MLKSLKNASMPKLNNNSGFYSILNFFEPIQNKIKV
jgi:hypothetical protein